MKSKFKIIGAVLLFMSLVFTVGCKKEEPKVELVSESVQEDQTIDAFGVVKAKRIKNINIDFPALIEEIPVGEGHQVVQNQVLVVLDTEEFNMRIRVKEHELNIQRLQQEKLRNNIYKNENEDPAIKILLNNLKLAEAEYLKAQQDFITQETLFKEGAISRIDLEIYITKLDVKDKELEDAQYELELKTQAKKGELDELKIQGERVRMLEKELSSLKEKLNPDYLDGNQVISNFLNGMIYDIGYAPGDSINPEKKLLSLMDLDSLIVEAEIPEEFIKDVKLGAEAMIIPLADKDRVYKGEITHISNQAIQKNGETIVPIEITMNTNDEFLRPNFNVDIHIPMGN